MKPKIIQVRGAAIEGRITSIDHKVISILNKIHSGNWRITNELSFPESYKTNKRGCHFDIYLGQNGIILFRPFNYVDGLDNWCYFDLKKYSENQNNAIEFYQWSSKNEAKFELWNNAEHLITASQKKSIRCKGNKSLIKNNDVYLSASFYIKNIVGKSIEELDETDKIYRCERI